MVRRWLKWKGDWRSVLFISFIPILAVTLLLSWICYIVLLLMLIHFSNLLYCFLLFVNGGEYIYICISMSWDPMAFDGEGELGMLPVVFQKAERSVGMRSCFCLIWYICAAFGPIKKCVKMNVTGFVWMSCCRLWSCGKLPFSCLLSPPFCPVGSSHSSPYSTLNLKKKFKKEKSYRKSKCPSFADSNLNLSSTSLHFMVGWKVKTLPNTTSWILVF